MLLELLQIITQPAHFVPGMGITNQVGFSYCTFFSSILWRDSTPTPLLLVLHIQHINMIITMVQVVVEIVSQHMIRQLLIKLPEVHMSFHLQILLNMPLSTLQVNVISSENIKILGIKHRWVTTIKTEVWHAEFM